MFTASSPSDPSVMPLIMVPPFLSWYTNTEVKSAAVCLNKGASSESKSVGGRKKDRKKTKNKSMFHNYLSISISTHSYIDIHIMNESDSADWIFYVQTDINSPLVEYISIRPSRKEKIHQKTSVQQSPLKDRQESKWTKSNGPMRSFFFSQTVKPVSGSPHFLLKASHWCHSWTVRPVCWRRVRGTETTSWNTSPPKKSNAATPTDQRLFQNKTTCHQQVLLSLPPLSRRGGAKNHKSLESSMFKCGFSTNSQTEKPKKM